MKQREGQPPCSQEKDNNSELFKEEGRRVALSRKTAINEALPKGWQRVKVIDFSPLQRGFDLPVGQIREGAYPVVYSNGINNYHSEYKSKAPGVVTGRSGTIGEVTYVIQDYWPHNTSLWVTDFKDNHPKFVFYALQNLRLDRFYAGSGVPTLNRNDVHKQSILVPPPSEQKAIASLLETWDTAIEKTEALVVAQENQFKWLMKTLISDQQGNNGWRWVRLNTVSSVKTGPFGAQLHQHDYVQSNGTPIVTVEHLSERGLLHKNLPLVSHHDKQRLSQYLIQEGDIVFSRVGSVDRSSLVSKDEDGWLFSGRLLRVRPKRFDVYSSYLNYFFHTRKFRHHMKSIAVGGTMPSINTNILSNVIVPLPSMDEQKAIASLLETWDTAIEKTKALAEQYRTQKRGLMQKLLTGKWRIK